MNFQESDYDHILDSVERILKGRPIREVLSVLLMTTATALIRSSDGDPEKLAKLIIQYATHLTTTVRHITKEEETLQ